jgi:hypothetical protein
MDSCSTNETHASSQPVRSFSSSRSRSSSCSHTSPRRRSPSPTESLTSWCTIPPYEPSPAPEAPYAGITKQGRGLYIQFSSSFSTSEPPPSYYSRPEPMRSKSAICRLKRTIATAVQDAGMESPTVVKKQDAFDSDDTSGLPQQNSSKSLFRGTYGQVMSALKDAGLMTTPCTEAGLEDGTWKPRVAHEVTIVITYSLHSNATWSAFCRGIQRGWGSRVYQGDIMGLACCKYIQNALNLRSHLFIYVQLILQSHLVLPC